MNNVSLATLMKTHTGVFGLLWSLEVLLEVFIDGLKKGLLSMNLEHKGMLDGAINNLLGCMQAFVLLTAILQLGVHGQLWALG